MAPRPCCSVLAVLGGICLAAGSEAVPPQAAPWAVAARNADLAQDVFRRCDRLVRAWYEQRGTSNALLPQNLRSRQWTPCNSAADLWSFFVITAHLTDARALEPLIRQTLADEIRLTTRLGALPDDYEIDRNAFVRREIDLARILFGASEYIKDGLLPIVELLGQTVWFDRIRGLIEGICTRAPVPTRFGNIPSEGAELNGNMLQSLSRFYAATGDARYKAWAERIGDAYFLEMLPKNNDLPCYFWDFTNGRPKSDALSLCDHGNEIIFGLSELVVLENTHDKAKAALYIPAMRRMLDKLLAVAVNEDGLFVHAIQPSTGKVTNPATPDTWGYALDAFYSFYMVTGEEKYRDAVHRALKGINAKEKYTKWNGSDSYADSIESGIVLLNRIPEPEGFAWLEKVVPVFLAHQKANGIVEGWHGDGNYARTALMYALMKTAGTRVSEWRPDIKVGAVLSGGKLHVLLSSEKPWSGTLLFDYPRHRYHFGLPMNYPRLNEFPEWFPLAPERSYRVTLDGKDLGTKAGDELIRGLPVNLAGQPRRVTVEPAPGPGLSSAVRLAWVPEEYARFSRAAGVRPDPPSPGVAIEAGIVEGELSLRVAAGQPWSGKLQFDYPRGLLHLGRRADRPRGAQSGAWYAIEPANLYQVAVSGKPLPPVLGDDLLRGLPVEVGKDPIVVAVRPLAGPPYGGKSLRLEAPVAHTGEGPFRLRLAVCNETGEPKEIRLTTTFGTVEPPQATLAPEARLDAALIGDLTKSVDAKIELATPAGTVATQTIKLTHEKGLVAFKAFDDQEYAGRTYLWCGKAPIEFELPARPGQPHTLHLLWGSKGDKRAAGVTVNGREHKLAHGGYKGYQWVPLKIEAAQATEAAFRIRLVPDLPSGAAAFIAEAKLTSP